MKILVIAGNNYPSFEEPQKGIFVYKIVQEFAKFHEVFVFAPKKRNPLKVYSASKNSYGDELGTVLRPKFWSFSNKTIFGFNTHHLGNNNMIKVLKRCHKEIGDVDMVYAHFLTNALVAVEAFKKNNLPIYAAVGEYKNIEVIKSYYNEKKYYSLVARIKGFIAVSPQVKQKLLSLEIATDQNILVAPNGVNTHQFKPSEYKMELRKTLGLPSDKKIVLFVGRFLNQKGPERVIKAIEKINKENYRIVLIGSGSQKLDSPYIQLKASLTNEMVSKYMAAADIFVLPTLHEGSSNVIVEAMACGLPIVSSDLPEIRVQCEKSFSILVDPLSIDKLAKAIDSILSDPKKNKSMGAAARNHACKFSIERRSENILGFIGSGIARK